jgi:hypothetical protein
MQKKILKYGLFPFQFIWSLAVYLYYSRKYKYTDYFDYKKLVNLHFLEPKGFNAVCHYGTYKCVAKLTNRKFNFITDYVEHSVNFITEPEMMKYAGYYNRPTIRRIYAMSESNVSVYNQCIAQEYLKSKVIATGPYILGAEFFESPPELAAIKQKYGRILLVYPHHSVDDAKTKFDVDEFIAAIKKYKEEFRFDSVFICLYWLDILNHQDETYKQHGFVIVTAGHRSDPHFISRTKDLIYLADHTMSNFIGSYVGYSIVMGKPHFMYNQHTQYTYVNGQENGKEKVPPQSFQEAQKTFQQAFGTFTDRITPEQKKWVEKYWGKWEK